ALQGKISTHIYQGVKTIGLRVIFPLEYKKFIENLKNLPIFTQNGKYILLGNLADIKIKMKPRIAYSQNGMQVINMEIKTDSKNLQKNVKMIESKLNKLKLPQDVNVELAGDWKNQQNSFKQLLYIVTFAVFLIFILLLWQFKKYTVAFIVFSGAILSLSFVVYGLFITKTSFNVSAFIGLIISLGIVVNNGILVVSFIEDIKKKSSSIKNAIIEASTLRVRAIMITSITTIGGFLPMAMKLGYGGEMLQPLSIAIIFGLIGSMMISLVVIPCSYMFFIKK
ncbi:MAG: efflux RND transporter permease subunit, partial [Epsilonproteobacteria bacterium]|nr:efflux RND transporter permease subunit [Campylobacterota bacterium]